MTSASAQRSQLRGDSRAGCGALCDREEGPPAVERQHLRLSRYDVHGELRRRDARRPARAPVLVLPRHLRRRRAVLPSHAPALGGSVVGVLGGYIGFAALFLNNQAYNRYFESYFACCACQGRIFDAVTLASASLRPEAAAVVARYCCAAFLAGFVGLSPEHYSADVLASFVTKHDLLTTAEWDALVAAGGFEGTGDRYRALIAWALRLVANERDAGRCDGGDAWLLNSLLLQLRAKLADNYDLIDRPPPFVYVHLVCVLTEIFVPVFAFALTRISQGTITDHVLAVAAIVVTNFFFLAINITTKKLADPYGHDLDDIHILSLCKVMPGACARILETSPPPRSAETTTTFVRSN